MLRIVTALIVLLIAFGVEALPPGFPQGILVVGNDLTLWNRTYTFDTQCGPFPKATGVVSSCAIQLDGSTLTWTDPVVQSNTGELAVLTTSATQGNFQVTATTTVDIAGIARIDPSVKNISGGSDAFSWKAAITLDASLDVYLNRHVGYDPITLLVEKGIISTFFGNYTNGCFEFVPSFEVHDHLKGFEWILDGDYDYLPANRATGCAGAACTPLCTADSGGSPVMSVEPFSSTNQKTLAPSATWNERYIVVVHPTRPTLEDWRGLQSTNATQIPGWFRSEALTGKRFLTFGFTGNVSGVTPYSGLPRYVDDANLRAWLANGKADGIEMLPYGAGHRSFYLHPTHLANRADWSINSTGRQGLDLVGDVAKETQCCPDDRNFSSQSHVNVDGDPWMPPWQAPWLANPSTNVAPLCVAVDEPFACCTGKGTASGCIRQDMAYGFQGFCDNEQDGNDEGPWKAGEIISAFLDPRQGLDGLYFDHGNLARSCSADPRITDASQQVWFYDNFLSFYELIYRGMKANGGPAIVSTRAANPLMVLHASGAPRALMAWADVGSWGEGLGDEFGTIGTPLTTTRGCGWSGCADGACNDGTEACVAWSSSIAATCVGVGNPSPCCDGAGVATAKTGCGFCPDYVGIGQDTVVAVSKPHSGGVLSSMLAMARDVCVNDADSSSYWARNIWTTWLGMGITHGVASDFAQEGGSNNILRQHASILDDFGSVLDEDLLATYAYENSSAYSTTGGILVTIYAHPSMTGCVAECTKKAILIIGNWTNANIVGASLTINDHAALGLTEDGNAINCLRTWDPSTVLDSSSSTTAQWGAWTSDTSPFTGLNVAAKSYLAIEAKYGPTCP